MSASSGAQTAMDTAARIIGLAGGIIGIVGGVLGIVSWLTSGRRERRAREEQDSMWRMYEELREAQRKNPLAMAWDFDAGSAEHEMAEMMVERELLNRLPRGGGYCLHEAVSESTYS